MSTQLRDWSKLDLESYLLLTANGLDTMDHPATSHYEDLYQACKRKDSDFPEDLMREIKALREYPENEKMASELEAALTVWLEENNIPNPSPTPPLDWSKMDLPNYLHELARVFENDNPRLSALLQALYRLCIQRDTEFPTLMKQVIERLRDFPGNSRTADQLEQKLEEWLKSD